MECNAEILCQRSKISQVEWKIDVAKIAADGSHDASVLVQVGRLDPDNLPVAGVAEARKVADETLPSNALMPNWAKSEGKRI